MISSAPTVSLVNFLAQWPDILYSSHTCLELGCGECSIFEHSFTDLDIQVTALDHRSEAIAKAKQASVNSKVSYFVHDAKVPRSGKYELIIDAHLLHMLTTQQQRYDLLASVESNLLPGGYFIGETMAYNKGLEFSLPYYFDKQDEVLYKLVADQWVAQRAIFDVYRIEQELLKFFTIIYFYVDSCLEFQFSNIKQSHVSSLKFICQKR